MIALAAALAWQERIAPPVALATFDWELWEAARQASLTVWPEESPPDYRGYSRRG